MSTTAEKRVYNSARWRRVRARVIAAAGGRCQMRRRSCTGRAVTADHIIPLSRGGAPFDPSNLRAACQACNTAATFDPGNIRRAGRRRPSRRWI